MTIDIDRTHYELNRFFKMFERAEEANEEARLACQAAGVPESEFRGLTLEERTCYFQADPMTGLNFRFKSSPVIRSLW